MMTTLEGWRRFPGHFALFAAAPFAAGFILQQLDHRLPLAIAIAAFAATAAYIIHAEIRSTRRMKQTVGKAVLDAVAKLGGLATGLALANWWHPLSR